MIPPEAAASPALGQDRALAHLSAPWPGDPPPDLGARLAAPRPGPGGDAHERWAERDPPERAGRYLAAAARVEALAAAGVRPDWPALREVQALVLGGPADFRAGEARALGGRHRHGVSPRLGSLFARKLAHDRDAGAHAVVAGVRLYLDLVHVHPFEDGNARAARLGLGWWLRLAGLPLPVFEPLVRLPKPPGAPPWTFVALVAALVAR